VILLEWKQKDALDWCGSIWIAGRNAPPLGMEWEHYDIIFCQNFKMPLQQAWPKLKTWN
jgi:hypothetical protein